MSDNHGRLAVGGLCSTCHADAASAALTVAADHPDSGYELRAIAHALLALLAFQVEQRDG